VVRALVIAALIAAVLAVAPASAAPVGAHQSEATSDPPRIHWRDSVAIGLPEAGSLVRGVQLPPEGRHYFTWDPILTRQPNRPWRRWATDDLIRTLLHVIRGYARAHPGAPRVGIGDLSRPHGGDFGAQFGGLGHATHQNGLDADVLYPRLDGLEARAMQPSDVDQHAAQELIDRFLAAGAVKIFVGPHLHHLHGPKHVVIPLIYHDDHMHVRIR
jgi:murein endopeptidase